MKPIYKSWTIWTNFAFVVALIIQAYSKNIVDPQLQVLLISIANVLLRFKTDSAVTIDSAPVETVPTV